MLRQSAESPLYLGLKEQGLRYWSVQSKSLSSFYVKDQGKYFRLCRPYGLYYCGKIAQLIHNQCVPITFCLLKQTSGCIWPVNNCDNPWPRASHTSLLPSFPQSLSSFLFSAVPVKPRAAHREGNWTFYRVSGFVRFFSPKKGFNCGLGCPRTLLQTRLAFNSHRSACLCLLSARIKGVCYQSLACL